VARSDWFAVMAAFSVRSSVSQRGFVVRRVVKKGSRPDEDARRHELDVQRYRKGAATIRFQERQAAARRRSDEV